jgi:hypothetical protein
LVKKKNTVHLFVVASSEQIPSGGFTGDGVLASYVKGKNYISDEVRKVLNRTIPLATKYLPDVVKQIGELAGISVPSYFMKISGLTGYDVLCAVAGDDYLSTLKMRKAYVAASEIEDTLYANSFRFTFRFVMQSESLNVDMILSEGYRLVGKI